MRSSTKTALGGIVAALSVTLMLLSAVVPFLEYALPAFSGALLLLLVIELGRGWAFGAYLSVSILSLIMLTNKEAAMMYVAFFGWYPVIKQSLERVLRLKPLAWLVKIVIFACSMVAAYFILIKLFGMRIEDLTDHGLKGLLGLLGMAVVMFVVLDVCMSRLILLYERRWQKKFRKLFGRKD